MGAADGCANAAAAVVWRARLHSRERGRLFVVRIALRIDIFPGAVSADRAGLRAAWRRAAPAALDGDAVRKRPVGWRAGQPLRRTSDSGRWATASSARNGLDRADRQAGHGLLGISRA